MTGSSPSPHVPFLIPRHCLTLSTTNLVGSSNVPGMVQPNEVALTVMATYKLHTGLVHQIS